MTQINLTDIKKELEAGINTATTVADLADHFAQMAKRYGKFIPGAGSEISSVAGLIDDGDKLLHTLQKFLG